MMKYIFSFLLLLSYVFANEAIVGKSFVILSKNPGSIEFLNKKIPLYQIPNKKEFVAFIPVDYRTKPGKYNLFLNKEKRVINIVKGNYKKEVLKVDSTKVKPPKKYQDRIYKEYQEATKIYAKQTKKRYWKKPFIAPLSSKITSDFGNARVFNSSLKSYHSGTDFRAKVGTPIKAANDGVVVISKNRYYAGGSIVIDHGYGLYSCYYHLSKLNLKVGESVKQGDIVGLSGKSGRVTGPHLHFTIMLQGSSVDPLDFFSKVNSLFISY